MGYAVRMPQLGMTMEEGVVVEWCFDEGEPFDEGELIAVVESEKTQNDVEARADGQYIEQFVAPNQTVGPGDPIAYVGDEGEEVPDEIREEVESAGEAGGAEADESAAEDEQATAGAGAEAADAAGAGAEAASTTGAQSTSAQTASKVSPRARSFAQETDGVSEADLATLQGSGPDGAVVEADVAQAVEAGTLGGSQQTAAAGGGQGRTVSGSVSVDGRDIYERREGSRLRKAVADRMTQSAREAPQVTLNRAVPVGDLLDLKERLAEDRELELSLSDFLLAAVADALEEYPEFNALYRDGVHELAGNVNIGVAVDAENGLLTPVIEGAGQRSLTDLAAERNDVVQRALAGEHTHDDLSGGTFTITNLGHFGVDTFDPIVNPPQVAILGVGTIQDAYDPESGESTPELNLSLTFDHRPVDGADGARFLDAIAEGLTRPLRLLTLAGDVSAPAPAAEESESADEPGSVKQNGTFRSLEESSTDARAAQATSAEEMQATVRSRTFEWDVDEPEDVGGSDTAPNPVEQFLGSLASCLSLMIRNMADRREVPIDSVEVSVDASPEHGSIEQIDVQVAVVSDAPAEDVEDVVEMAERACYVNRVVDDDVEQSVSVTVDEE